MDEKLVGKKLVSGPARRHRAHQQSQTGEVCMRFVHVDRSSVSKQRTPRSPSSLRQRRNQRTCNHLNTQARMLLNARPEHRKLYDSCRFEDRILNKWHRACCSFDGLSSVLRGSRPADQRACFPALWANRVGSVLRLNPKGFERPLQVVRDCISPGIACADHRTTATGNETGKHIHTYRRSIRLYALLT